MKQTRQQRRRKRRKEKKKIVNASKNFANRTKEQQRKQHRIARRWEERCNEARDRLIYHHLRVIHL